MHSNEFLDRGLARLYRGRLIPIMRGGDDRDPLFPDLPTDFAALSEEDLQAFIDASMAARDRIRDQDPEFLGDLTAEDVLTAMQSGVTGILAARAEQAIRVEAQANLAAELASLAAQADPAVDPSLNADDPADPVDPAADPADPAADPVVDPAEPIVASGDPDPAAPTLLRRAPAQGRHVAPPADAVDSGMVLTSSANVDGFAPGETLDASDGPSPLNRALVAAMRRKTATPAGFRDEVVVASADIRSTIPEHRRIRIGDAYGESNEQKIRTLTAAADKHGVGIPAGMDWAEAEALTAGGGICAPVTPYYELAFISSMERPVRDSLVGFVGDRGGINFAQPPYLQEITTGVGVMTATQDADGASKTCQTLVCPSFTSVDVQQIWHCFTGGNLGQRAFPEQAAQFGSLILTAHARLCETQLLNQIKAGSTQVLGQATVLGAISSLLNDMLTAAAGYRSANRMPRNAPLQVIIPQWTADLLLIDLIQSQFDRFSKDQTGLEALFAAFNLRVTYSMDGPTDGEGQVFARQAAGYLTGFPTVVEYAMFHPGGVLFVDSGLLELGIVRDSVLNAENNYQVWGESFEVAVVVAVQSLWITSNVCASGSVALPINNLDQCGT